MDLLMLYSRRAIRAYGSLWVLLIASIALTVCMAWVLSRCANTLSNGAAWVAHTERIRFQVAQLLASMSALGQGLSGNGRTMDREWFAAALAVDAALPGEIAALEQSVLDEPAERPLVASLVDLARRRQLETRSARDADLRGEPLSRARLSDDSRRIMDPARALGEQLQSVESTILGRHQLALQSARVRLQLGIDAAAAIAVLLLCCVTFVTVNGAERRRKLEAEGAAARRASRSRYIALTKELREADQRKDEFLATLSHELRNPLAPIRNAAQILGSPTLAPEQLQWAHSVIRRQVKHMASLLDDLLDVARITRGKLELKKEKVFASNIVDVAVEAARPLLDAKHHQLTLKLPAEPVALLADSVRLSQVIGNLLTNAAKYTEPFGHIECLVQADRGHLRILVKDDGVGIAPEHLERIFDMFTQIDRGSFRAEGGLGIGLSLVKGLTEMHGGTVTVRSAGLGCGSEFELTFPVIDIVEEWRDGIAGPASPTAGAGRRVLIADDNEDAADSLAMILELSGHEVRVAHDGGAALVLAQSFRPEIALLDIGMPELSGYEVAARLRGEPWAHDMQMIALTGWGQERDRQRAMEAGFNLHMTKPIDTDVLQRAFVAPSADP
jgi:signal transduction histidine kinase